MPICVLSQAEPRLGVTWGCVEVMHVAKHSLNKCFLLGASGWDPSSVFLKVFSIGWQFYPA